MKLNYFKINTFLFFFLFSGIVSAACTTSAYIETSPGTCQKKVNYLPSPPSPPNTCPNASSYNPSYSTCLRAPDPLAWYPDNGCFPSYTYDPANHWCGDSNQYNYDPLLYPVGGSTYICPAGQVYQTSTSTCVTPPTCSPSETYDSATNTCLANAGSTVSSAVVVHVLPAVFNSLLNDVIDLFDIAWLAILAIFLWFILFRIFRRSANEAR